MKEYQDYMLEKGLFIHCYWKWIYPRHGLNCHELFSFSCSIAGLCVSIRPHSDTFRLVEGTEGTGVGPKALPVSELHYVHQPESTWTYDRTNSASLGSCERTRADVHEFWILVEQTSMQDSLSFEASCLTQV